MASKKQARRRSRHIVAHRAQSYAEAEQWDLEFWQKQTPQDRLSALVAIHEDIAKVKAKRS